MRKCTRACLHRCWALAALILFSWSQTAPSTRAAQLHPQFASWVFFATSLKYSVHAVAGFSMSTVSQSGMNCMDVSIGKNSCRSILGHTMAQVWQPPGGQFSQLLPPASLSPLLVEVPPWAALPGPPRRARRLPQRFAAGKWWGWALGRWRQQAVGI